MSQLCCNDSQFDPEKKNVQNFVIETSLKIFRLYYTETTWPSKEKSSEPCALYFIINYKSL